MTQQDESRRKHPFYIGQSHDDVVTVCNRTGRRRSALVIIGEDGQAVPVSSSINLASVLVFRSTYTDVILTFKRGKLPDGSGAACYRIAEIREREKNDDR